MAGLLGGSRIGGLLGDFGAQLTQTAQTNPELFQALSQQFLQTDPRLKAAAWSQAAGDRQQRLVGDRAYGENVRQFDQRMKQDQNQFDESLGIQRGQLGLSRSRLQFEQDQLRQAQSATAGYLASVGAPDELVALARSGAGAEALKLYKAAGGGDTEYGLQPVYGRDAQGNIVIGQLGKDGSLKQSSTPGNFVPMSPEELNYGRAYGGAMGKTEAGQFSAAPGEVQAADNALGLIDKIRNDPNLDWGVGGTSMLNGIPGSPGRDFQKRVDQATAGGFLQAIQEMKGLGALSEQEGRTATAAINRMDTSTSKEEFLDALNDYETIVKQGRDRAAGRMGGRQVERPAPVKINGYTIEAD